VERPTAGAVLPGGQPTAEESMALEELAGIYRRAEVIEHRGRLITINAFTDQSEPLGPRLLRGLASLMARRVEHLAFDIVVGEEDKGAHIATAVSFATDAPLILARQYVYPIESIHRGAAVVDLRSEYLNGRLVLNGISPGMRALIVDDTLSTGGTVIALIDAIRRRGGQVVGAVATIEKVDEGGRVRVFDATDVTVLTMMKIRATREGVVVL